MSLLSIREVMGFHMYIALIVSDWDYDYGLIIINEMKSKHVYDDYCLTMMILEVFTYMMCWNESYDLYEVHALRWVICEVCDVMICYAFMSMHLCLMLMKIMWIFTLVTLRWCLSVVSGMRHYPCIAPSISWGLRGG